jgi:hypothetical protein
MKEEVPYRGRRASDDSVDACRKVSRDLRMFASQQEITST